MHFTAIYPEAQNFTPTDLMINFCANNATASFERDKYFSPYIYTNGHRYYYDHWKLEYCIQDHICVTVFLAEKPNANELPDFTSPEAFFCEPD